MLLVIFGAFSHMALVNFRYFSSAFETMNSQIVILRQLANQAAWFLCVHKAFLIPSTSSAFIEPLHVGSVILWCTGM